MVRGHEKDMLLRRESNQSHAEHQIAFEGEGLARLVGDAFAQAALLNFRSRGRQVNQRYGHLRRGCDYLHGLPLIQLIRRAEHFMSHEDFLKTALQRSQIQATGEMNGLREIVERSLRLELVQEPKSLLGEGERRRFPTLGGQDWRCMCGRL